MFFETITYFLNFVIYIIIGIELFVNMSLKGVYKIPALQLTNKQNVIYGVMLSIAFSVLMTSLFKINLVLIVGALIIYYIYKNGFNYDDIINLFTPMKI